MRMRVVPNTPGAQLTEVATPAAVASLRQRVAELVSELGASERVVDAVRLCVSEAAANAALHAYGDEPGQVEIVVEPDRQNVNVTVRDEGRGIRDVPRRDGGGYGLTIIETLADGFAVDSTPGEGTEVRMTFRLSDGTSASL